MMSKKRLLYLSLAELELSGGPTVHTNNLLKGFNQVGVQVLLLTPKPSKKISQVTGVKYQFLPFFGFSAFRLFLFNWVSFFYVLVAIFRFRPHYFYVREMEDNVSVLLASFLTGTPFFMDVNGPMEMDYAVGKDTESQEKGILKGSAWSRLCRKWMRQFQFLISKGSTYNTEGWRQTLSKEFKVPLEKSILVSMYVDTQLFKPMSQEECRRELGLDLNRLIIGYTGTFQPTHEIEGVFTALKWLLEQGLDCSLLMVGGGNRYEAHRREIEKTDLSKHVIFAGWVPHEKIPLYLNSFSVGAALLKSHKAYAAESLLKVKEYLACGIPTVTNQTPGDSFRNYPDGLFFTKVENGEQIGRSLLEALKVAGVKRNKQSVDFIRENYDVRLAAEKTIAFMEQMTEKN